MVIATASLLVLFLALCYWGTAKEPPMDRDVIRRIRSFADQIHREQFLPFD